MEKSTSYTAHPIGEIHGVAAPPGDPAAAGPDRSWYGLHAHVSPEPGRPATPRHAHRRDEGGHGSHEGVPLVTMEEALRWAADLEVSPAVEADDPGDSTQTPRLPHHLIPERSGRGIAYYPTLPGTHGERVHAYESSAALEPAVWLAVREDSARGVVETVAHLSVGDAWRLAEQLAHLVARHYQGDARPPEAERRIDLVEGDG